MSDLFGGWIQESDYTQSRRIRELSEDLGNVQSSLSRATRTASALRSDLASLRGSIEARLTRLTEAFDAFVELSSLKDQLALVAGGELVRQATRARLVALGTTRKGPVLDVAGSPPAPGYWLADALAALGTDDTAAAERGAAIDRRRTATFLTIAGAACGLPALADRWAADALGDLTPGEPVTRAQRVLWEAAAEGLLGEDARALLDERLAGLVAALPPATADEQRTAYGEQVQATAGYWSGGPRSAEKAGQARQAVGALATLRTLVEPPPTADGTPVYGTPDEAPAATAADPAAARAAILDEMAAVLRALVDEGAEEEREVMARVAELEAIVSGTQGPGPAWDVPAGDVLTLLRQDALTRRDAVGAAARRATAPWLREIADAALAASDVAPPEHVEAQVMGLTLRARHGQGVEGVDAALEKARTPHHPATPLEKGITTGLAVAAGVFLLAAVVDSTDLAWLYGTVAIAAGVATVARLVQRRSRTADDAARITRGVAFVEREVAQLEQRAAQAVQAAESAREDAREHHARIVALLDGTGATGDPAAAGDDDASDPDAVLTGA